jgi:hypothetical protein
MDGLPAICRRAHRASGERNHGGVVTEEELVRVVEAAARAIITAEFAAWDKEGPGDNEHIPRMRRVARAAGAAASGLGIGKGAAARVTKRLLQHAEDEYMQRWMADLEDGEDPDEVREDGIRTFRHVAAGGRR